MGKLVVQHRAVVVADELPPWLEPRKEEAVGTICHYLDLYGDGELMRRLKYCKDLSLPVILERKDLAIGNLAKIAEEATIQAIGLMLIDFTDEFADRMKLSAGQIERFTQHIIVEYGHILKLDDVMLFLQKVSNEEYGDLFERMDLQRLKGFLNKYVDHRLSFAEQQSIRRHNELKQGYGDVARVSENSSALELAKYVVAKVEVDKEMKLTKKHKK